MQVDITPKDIEVALRLVKSKSVSQGVRVSPFGLVFIKAVGLHYLVNYETTRVEGSLVSFRMLQSERSLINPSHYKNDRIFVWSDALAYYQRGPWYPTTFTLEEVLQ